MQFTLIAQTEVIEALKALSESIAAQQQTTQLTIVIVILLLVFGAIMIVLLRGGIQVFSKLSSAIDKLANVEDERHETQKNMVDAIEGFSKQNTKRYEHVDIMYQEIVDGLKDVTGKLDDLHSLLENNPSEHQKLYEAIIDLKNTLKVAKRKTDELPDLSDA